MRRRAFCLTRAIFCSRSRRVDVVAAANHYSSVLALATLTIFRALV